MWKKTKMNFLIKFFKKHFWKREVNLPKWIDKTTKMKTAYYRASHTQFPGSTRTYHLKGKNKIYKIKITSTGQYCTEKVYSKIR